VARPEALPSVDAGGLTTGARLPVRPAVVAAAALAASMVVGATMAQSPRLGVAATMALCYVPLVLLNLRVGIVLWLPLVFLPAVTALGAGPNAAGILILLAWLGAFATRDSSVPRLVAEHGRLLVGLAVLILWMTLSMAWAVRSPLGTDAFFGWLIAGAIVVVASTVLVDGRYLRLAAAAFVAGAVISVAVGLVGGAVQTPTNAAQEVAPRIVGGSGDPNFLAAGIVPAIALAFGLGAGSRRVAVRLAVLPAMAFLMAGLVATQSRGGLVAAVVAAAAALVLAPRGRSWVLTGLLWIVGAAIVSYLVDPVAWQRLADFNESSGRSELWSVAWRIWEDHPVAGVGMHAFMDNASSYVRELGPLEYAKYIVEQPQVVHNTYLELLAEAGIVGFALYTGVVAACVRCAWRAAGRFDRMGDLAMATLSRAVIVGVVAMLTAAFFISSETDQRLWVLLAMGPALLAAAKRQARLPGGDKIADREPALTPTSPARRR
jgi:O-antigen ligase